MEKHDEEIEHYLREFQPRAIRELEIEPPAGNRWLRRLAAAAGIVISAGILVWYAQWETRGVREEGVVQHLPRTVWVPQRSMNTVILTRLALEDSDAFEVFLTNKSRSVLPSVQGEQSTLRVLAKE